MKIFNTKIKDLKIIQHNKFIDNRGFLKITFHNKIINLNKFKFEYAVTSKTQIIPIIVGDEKKAMDFGKYYSIILSANAVDGTNAATYTASNAKTVTNFFTETSKKQIPRRDNSQCWE